MMQQIYSNFHAILICIYTNVNILQLSVPLQHYKNTVNVVT